MNVETVLDAAGITINGPRPYDIQIHNPDTIPRVLSEGTMGLGESYMDGWWEVPELDEFIYKVLSAELDRTVAGNIHILLEAVKSRFFNLQTLSRSLQVGRQHYDIGNDLYQTMLDKRLVYTCAYWKHAENLDDAQEDKLDLVCRKINLKAGMTVLDIGCGFGSFAKFAAEKYGAVVTGVTISKNQIELGTKLCEGLPVTLLFQDYRKVAGTFDRIVSLGMFEHVGHKNYRAYMQVAARHLKDDGIFLLHTIGSLTGPGADPWFSKYIFPNSELPTAESIAASIKGLFVMEDWHNFGAYYDRTLLSWHRNFEGGWNRIRASYSERFRRMWRFYLLSSAGAFRARRNQLWQIVLSKRGIPGGYASLR